MQRRLRLLLRAQGAASFVTSPVTFVDEALAGPPRERAYRGVRDLLAGRRGHDNGSGLVCARWRGYGLCRSQARAAVYSLFANQSYQLLARGERCDPWDVQRLDWNLHGLPQRVPPTVQGRGGSIHQPLDTKAARGESRRD